MEPSEVRDHRKQKTSHSTTITLQSNAVVQHAPNFQPEKFSSFTGLIRVVATVQIALDKLRRLNTKSFISAECLATAEWTLVRQNQLEYFADEFAVLKAGKALPRQSKILNLKPFYDIESSTIRVGGRLSQGLFRELKKFPLLVSQNSRLAHLILLHYHEATLHGGAELTVNSSREEFWIPTAKVLVKKVIKQCIKCSRFENKIPYQLMADLPAERITPEKPFQTCGLDLAGPIYTKPGVKTYIAIFVSLVVKAVHIELVADLTKEACISALKRFVARRGSPTKILSDNGTNFIGDRNDIIKAQEILALESNDSSIATFITQKAIEWETKPPRAPHFGGLWEAAVKSMKRHLRRTVGLQILSFEDLNTLVIQIEAILNSRPLSAMSNDPNDLQPVTPAHFLLGRASRDSISLGQRLKLLEASKRQFWKAWYRDYLVTLQIRKRWLQSGPNFNVGDLVLIAEDNLPPLRWKMARITQLYSGNDQVNRVAELKTTSGDIIRPVVKLRKLPVDDSSH